MMEERKGGSVINRNGVERTDRPTWSGGEGSAGVEGAKISMRKKKRKVDVTK